MKLFEYNEVEEIINDPDVNEEYRKQLRILADNDDAQGFDKLLDIIAIENFGYSEEELAKINKEIYGQ